MIIVLVRHGEARKNLQHRHGEVDPALALLTEAGRLQAAQLASQIRASAISLTKVLHTPRPQCKETAELIAGSLNLPIQKWDKVPAYNLGILEGLSDREVQEQHPVHGRLIEDYRNGKLELCDVVIPGATDPQQYYSQASNAVAELLRNSESIIIVASRSVLIAITSVLLNRSPVRGGGYREIAWSNGAAAVFEIRNRAGASSATFRHDISSVEIS
jgi:broad specificity phosphatase PhoE